MRRFIPHHTEDYAWFIDFAPHVFYITFGDLFRYQNPDSKSLRQALAEAAQDRTVVVNAATGTYDSIIISGALMQFNVNAVVLVNTLDLKRSLHNIDCRWFPHNHVAAIAGNIPPSQAGITEEDIANPEFWKYCTQDVQDLITFYDKFKTNVN
jgi:hypothetical protein